MESFQVYGGDGSQPLTYPNVNKLDEFGNRHGWWYTAGLSGRRGFRPEFQIESAIWQCDHGVIDGPVWCVLKKLNPDNAEEERFFGYGMAITWEPENMTYPELNGWWAFHDREGIHQGYLDRTRRDKEWFTLPEESGRPFLQRWNAFGTPNKEESTQKKGEPAGWTGSSRPTHLDCIDKAWKRLGTAVRRKFDFDNVQNPYLRFGNLL